MLPNLTYQQIYYLRRKGVLPPLEKKTKKAAKKQYNNWFEKLTLTELQSLCRASKLAVSGTKAELCIRLCNGELSSDYAYEYARYIMVAATIIMQRHCLQRSKGRSVIQGIPISN